MNKFTVIAVIQFLIILICEGKKRHNATMEELIKPLVRAPLYSNTSLSTIKRITKEYICVTSNDSHKVVKYQHKVNVEINPAL